jgi:cell division ATPase FtsA
MHFLAEIISARYEQIFLKINKHLENLEKDWRLPGGILLIGGGSRTQNLDYLSKDTFKLATFYGKDQLVNIGDLSNNVQFVNVLGCYYWSMKYIDERRGGGIKIWKLGTKIGEFFKKLF